MMNRVTEMTGTMWTTGISGTIGMIGMTGATGDIRMNGMPGTTGKTRVNGMTGILHKYLSCKTLTNQDILRHPS